MVLERLNLGGVCVGCLNSDRKMFFSDKVMECLKLISDIHISDGLAVMMCWECTAYINNIFRFKTTIEHSYEKLLEYSLKDKSLCLPNEIWANSKQRFEATTSQLVNIPSSEVLVKTEIESVTSINYFPEEVVSTAHLVPIEFVKKDPSTNQLPDSKENENSLAGRTQFVCDNCARCYKYKADLIFHMEKHTGEKQFSCKLCSYKCSQKAHLTIHMQKHLGKKELSCNLCPYKCVGRYNLERHLCMHTGEKRFSCELCSYKSIQKCQLERHMSYAHEISKKYACNACSYKCIEKSTLINHMRLHGTDKSFSCKLCPYQCKVKEYLKKHMLKHTGKKQLTCDFCSYKSCRISDLKRHIRIHTGEKPFNCNFCPYKCTQSGHLKMHIVRCHPEEVNLDAN